MKINELTYPRTVLHVLASPGDPLHKSAGVRAWNFENDRSKIIKGALSLIRVGVAIISL